MPPGAQNGPIELKFEIKTQNLLLFDICSVFRTENGDFHFWGSSLTNPQNDIPIIFLRFFCVLTLGYEKNIKSQ